jgi:hypothetical protein
LAADDLLFELALFAPVEECDAFLVCVDEESCGAAMAMLTASGNTKNDKRRRFTRKFQYSKLPLMLITE